MNKYKNLEHNYLKTIESENFIDINKNKRFIEEWRTVEMFSLPRLCALRAYLTDYLIDHSPTFVYRNGKPKVSSNLVKVKDQLIFIENILNTSEAFSTRASIIDNEVYLERILPYGRLSEDSIENSFRTGRIYPFSHSAPYLSRDIRSYLFSDSYFDVDLENSHPTILAAAATGYHQKSPTLDYYVKNREIFLQNVGSYLQIDRDKAKKAVLIALNKNDYKSRCPLLVELHHEVNVLRLYLFHIFYDRKHRKNMNIPILQELERRPNYVSKTLEEKMLTFQSYYCFDKESQLLLKLKEHLEEQLGVKSTTTFENQKSHLHFIPFFDGAYIKFKNDSNTVVMSEFMIEEYLEAFNNKNKPFKFQLKSIRTNDPKSYINLKLLKDYEDLLITETYKTEFRFSIDNSSLGHYLNSDSKSLREIKAGSNLQFNDFLLTEYALYGYRLRKSLGLSFHS